jgi:hypothetical protein
VLLIAADRVDMKRKCCGRILAAVGADNRNLERVLPVAQIPAWGPPQAGARSMIARGFGPDFGRVFTHIHDQEIEISERFYLDLLT